MGQMVLSSYQLNFLELAQAETFIAKRYYLTGGTALTAFYYQHRLSEDLDFFTEIAEVNLLETEKFIKKIIPKLKIEKYNISQFLGLVSYHLIFRDGEKLKVDFNYYPFPRIEKGKKFKNLSIDSVYDIAVNKVHTLFMRPRMRDYVDLFFILNKENYPLKKLIIDAKAKFDWDIDRVTLSSQFLRVKEFLKEKKDFPKMLVPFSQKKMEDFYLFLAKSFEKEIFK